MVKKVNHRYKKLIVTMVFINALAPVRIFLNDAIMDQRGDVSPRRSVQGAAVQGHGEVSAPRHVELRAGGVRRGAGADSVFHLVALEHDCCAAVGRGNGGGDGGYYRGGRVIRQGHRGTGTFRGRGGPDHPGGAC